MASTRRRKSQTGQAMLETALVFTATLCTILFIVDAGRLLFYRQYFTERAREGARWAAVNTYSPTKIANVVCYNDASATGSAPGFFGLTTSNVSVSQPTAVNGQSFISVTIQGFNTVTLIPYIAGNYTFPPITATMPVESAGATN